MPTLKEFFEIKDDETRPLMLWFAICHNQEEMEEALTYLKGLAEEIILGKNSFTVKIYTDKRYPPKNP